jgi:hypothetical protein
LSPRVQELLAAHLRDHKCQALVRRRQPQPSLQPRRLSCPQPAVHGTSVHASRAAVMAAATTSGRFKYGTPALPTADSPVRSHSPVFFANGATDPEVQPNQPLPPLTVTLPAHMRPAKEGADPTPYLVAFLDGPERDDPTQPSGLCRPQDELTPATLDLSIGDVTLVVPNQDPAAAGLGEIHAVYGCHGRVLLEDVTAPQSQ